MKNIKVSFIIFTGFITFLLIISCAGTPTPAAREAILKQMTEEYTILIEVNSAAANEGKFDDIRIEINGKEWIFEVEPLFPGEDALDDLYGYKPDSHWLVLTCIPGEELLKKEIHHWSLGHEVIKQIEDKLHTHIITIEADVHHNWYFDDLRQKHVQHTSCTMKGPQGFWPNVKEFAWYLDDKYSQLRSAREYVKNNPHNPVRIAHIDTGYDPNHMTYPGNMMRLDLGYNFYDDTDDARDPGTPGFFNQPGHGTGTLAILAGAYITWPSKFGYPEFKDYMGTTITADIIPVRIYPSVVQFGTRYMAQGIYYAIQPRGESKNICNVATMSMGGVASRAWAQAVNLAYLAGVAIFTASGDRFGDSPPATTVYPARFHRVVSVCGATAAYSPYYKKCNLCKLQESYGPDKVMDSAIATYVPNVPWAQYGCNQLINLNGGGTSLSTPQAAGAAALWLQLHGDEYDIENRGWIKVEAVRAALFETAKKDIPGMTAEEVFSYYGHGVLKAMDALHYKPDISSLKKQPEDTVSHPLLTLLKEYFESFFDSHHYYKDRNEAFRNIIKDMFELEIVQLHMGHSRLQKIISDHEEKHENINTNSLKKFVKTISTSEKASDELKEVMGYIHEQLTE